jgi:hypothetical protein
MRLSLTARRPPTALERLLGPKRARRLRRRLGLVALGAGYGLLKPRARSAAIAGAAALAVAVALIRWG